MNNNVPRIGEDLFKQKIYNRAYSYPLTIALGHKHNQKYVLLFQIRCSILIALGININRTFIFILYLINTCINFITNNIYSSLYILLSIFSE